MAYYLPTYVCSWGIFCFFFLFSFSFLFLFLFFFLFLALRELEILSLSGLMIWFRGVGKGYSRVLFFGVGF